MDTVQPEDPSQTSIILGREVKLYLSAPPKDVGHGNAYLVIEGHTIPFHTSEHGIHCGAVMFAKFATPWEVAEAFIRDLGGLPEYRQAQKAAADSDGASNGAHDCDTQPKK